MNFGNITYFIMVLQYFDEMTYAEDFHDLDKNGDGGTDGSLHSYRCLAYLTVNFHLKQGFRSTSSERG
jgi:hypothetical protein